MSGVFFSVVMPAYNAAATVEAAAASVLLQTFSDFELLIVDDGSTDDTVNILRAISAQDGRLRALRHDRNQGLSAARNTGLAAAVGEYLFFMDADDLIDGTLLHDAHAALAKCPADVVVFGLTEEYLDKDNRLQYTKRIAPSAGRFDSPEVVRRQVMPLEQETLFGYAWNKIYRASAIRIHGLTYESVPLIEDFLFNAAFFDRAASAVLLAQTPYHYRIRSGENLTARFVPDYFALQRRRVETLYAIHEKWDLLTPVTADAIGAILSRAVLSQLTRNLDPRAGMTAADRRKWLLALYTDPLFSALQPHLASGSGAAHVVGRLIAGRHTRSLLMLAQGIRFVRRRFAPVYARLKQSR